MCGTACSKRDKEVWGPERRETYTILPGHSTPQRSGGEPPNLCGECPFTSKTCSEKSRGRHGRGSTGTVSISQKGLIPQVHAGNLSGWHHHAGNQPRPRIHTQETLIPAVRKCFCRDISSLTLLSQLINQRLKIHLHFIHTHSPVYMCVCICMLTFLYLYLYLYVYLYISR